MLNPCNDLMNAMPNLHVFTTMSVDIIGIKLKEEQQTPNGWFYGRKFFYGIGPC
jgi:hypothetical protein